jgi:hypothetical protein
MRQIFMEEATANIFDGTPEQALTAFNELMGCTMKIGENNISGVAMIAVLVLSVFVFLGLSIVAMNRKR